ncbi:MAG: diacylglycerol kinase [Coriobacteriia bacterium]|nr:diacylglycerol kinase [Coriobacteriia bacterium]
MRTLVIVNTRAGGSDANLYDYLRSLGAYRVEVALRYFDNERPLEDALADAEEFDVVVAVGGDGTVSAICYALRNTGVPVLPYPAGTANLLALNLGIHLEPRALAEATVAGVAVRFDLGEIESPDLEHRPNSCVGFAIMAGAGYDASVVDAAGPMKASMGAAAYLLGALANPTPTISHFTIDLDGEHIETDGMAVLVVNFGRMQFDIEVARGADPRDGVFDVAVIRSRNIAELVPAVAAGIFDRAGGRDAIPGVDVYSARTVSVSAEPTLRMQYDGEVVDAFTPFTARVLPQAATLLLPADSPYARARR